MTIHIPRPVAVSLAVLLGLGVLGILAQQAPDLWKYIREEGM